MIIWKELVLILKHTTLEVKEAEVLESTELDLYFPENFITSINGHVKLTKTKQQYRDFHSTVQSSITNMYPTVWKIITFFLKKEEM